MEPRIFLLGVHNHQPVGNFPFVFERAFADCYLPFLQELLKHPKVKITAHYSGPLLEFMREKKRKAWAILKELVGRGQVELLGGGFYEPILTMIPEEDRQGQLRLMKEFLEENFGTRPRGAWLTERVWEPTLPKTLAAAGIEYTLLDEEHFHYAGVEDIHGYHITEDEGYPLKLFPIDKKLRYLVPFQSLKDVEAHLDEIGAGGGLAILGDDGEKFGLWPGTKKWVYEDGWLGGFLAYLEEGGVQTWTFSEALDRRDPKGRVYLPPASYEEMTEWVLEPGDAAVFRKIRTDLPPEARRFIRGGFFREFFLKYPESDHLHKRMLFVSRAVNHRSLAEAKKELYRGQDNDPYWHGIFGGLYLPHLREAAYEHLLRAETLTPSRFGWTAADFDVDGQTEILWRDKTFALFVRPSQGGGIIEMDHYPLCRNLTDVLAKRPESYHAQSSPEEAGGKSIHELAREYPQGAEAYFNYDRGPRHSCLDHMLPPETTFEQWQAGEFSEIGNFADQPYTYRMTNRALTMDRTGRVLCEGRERPVRVEKEIVPGKKEISIHYSVLNEAGEPVEFLFGSEWNFYQLIEEFKREQGRVNLCGGRLIFEASPPAGIWTYPLRTLSQSEKGYDIIHQGLCLLPWWKISLEGKKEFGACLRLRDEGGK